MSGVVTHFRRIKLMAVTNILNVVTVPEKFSTYVLDKTTELSTMVTAGIAGSDPVIGQLINGTPSGGRFIEVPSWNALSGEDDVFGEDDVSIGNITSKSAHATLLMRQKAWGTTDLAHVLGGADPMGAVGQMLADWWKTREQKIYLSILKALFDSTSGALRNHVNDISTNATAEATYISDSATLDTKQLLGDHYGSLGMVFMHSSVYTYLQKKGLITRTPIFNPFESPIDVERYLGYRFIVDDGMPVTNDGVYDTYFLGSNAFIRQDGTPSGFIGTETDRDKIGAKDYLINRRCMIIHPRGFSWNTSATLTETVDGSTRTLYYPNNTHLATPTNWTLATDHKKIPMACLRHKIG